MSNLFLLCLTVSYHDGLSRLDDVEFSQALENFAHCLLTQRAASCRIFSSSPSLMFAVLLIFPSLCPRQCATCRGIHKNVHIWYMLDVLSHVQLKESFTEQAPIKQTRPKFI